MKKSLFYFGLLGIVLFEIGKVYYIMPMPGSQRQPAVELAYFLHGYRWFFRIGGLLLIAAGSRGVFGSGRKWIPALAGLVALGVVVIFNFVMTADSMFKQPRQLVLKNRAENSVDENSVVLGVAGPGEARAYPIRYLVYHHQVQDAVGGKPVLVTYCSVCRTGRVYEPVVRGHPEKFRLVGMDQFNAMFEDATTGSWWRQATGEAVAGTEKGTHLPEVPYRQVTLRAWFEQHPTSLVMQPDEASRKYYDAAGKYERGQSRGELTRTDSGSWQDKSWVLGVPVGNASKAYDWNRLKQRRIIHDVIGTTPVVLVLASDDMSFAAFVRPAGMEPFTIERDIISGAGRSYDLSGQDLADPGRRLQALQVHQEFWHSWRTFHPETLRDN